MKKAVTFLLIVLFTFSYTLAQDDPYSGVLQELEDTSAVITEDNDEGVSVEMDEVVKEEQSDTTKIKFGKKDITIVDEEDGSTSLNIRDEDEDWEEDHDWRDMDHKNPNKFKGHWAGFEMGFNNFVDQDYSITRSGANRFMDLNTGRSWNVNLNFHQASFGLIGKHFGLVTGLGLEFNNYFFDRDNTITEDTEGNVVPVYFEENEISKSKLTTTFLNLPVLLELQIGKGSRYNRISISGGVIGSVKLGSHTKIVYRESKKKEKDSDDYSINPLRVGLTARIGFSNMQAFATYYITPFFEKEPELNPISVGLSWSFL